jgi:ABC-type Fe3+/spermidine/putrescine transport system ATPase subunit
MISLERIRKSYGQKDVLGDVTLEVRKHELLSLVGPSGCGKTTTLNIVAGLCQPDEGSVVLDNVLVDGRNGTHLVHISPCNRKVGYVFQEYALFPHMKVHENIAYGPESRHVSKTEVKKRTESLLRFVGLQDHSDHYPDQLSGGQKQRIALARALATEPDILLLDEPLAALDPRTRELLRVELKKILGSLEITTIYVTHELGEAYAVSDQIAVMGHGTIEQIGHRDDIFTKPNSAYVADFLGQNTYSGKFVGETEQASTIEINGIPISAKPTGDMTGRDVLVTIRPEDVLLSPNTPDGNERWNGGRCNKLNGAVVEIVRTSSTAEVKVDVGFLVKSVITVGTLEELRLREGGRVLVHLNGDNVGISPTAQNKSPRP